MRQEIEEVAKTWWNKYIINQESFVEKVKTNIIKQKNNDIASTIKQKNNDIASTIADWDIETHVAGCKDIKRQIQLLEKELKVIEDKIVDYFTSNNVDVVNDSFGTLLATYKTIARKGTFDSKKFSADHSDLYVQYLKKPTEYKKLTIK